MNLYIVSRTDMVRYDEYDSMVVSAESEDDARLMTPTDETVHDSCYAWTYNPETLIVELLGTSSDSTPCVVIVSYNAG